MGIIAESDHHRLKLGAYLLSIVPVLLRFLQTFLRTNPPVRPERCWQEPLFLIAMAPKYEILRLSTGKIFPPWREVVQEVIATGALNEFER